MTEETPKTKFSWTDWVERSTWTGVEAALAIIVVTDVSTLKAAATAFAAAVIAALKTLAKARLGR